MFEQKQELNSNPATPSDIVTNTPPNPGSANSMVGPSDASLMPPPPLPSAMGPGPSTNIQQLPQQMQMFSGQQPGMPVTTLETQQQQLLRQAINRPIAPNQLRAMKTGTYVQPGCSMADFINDLDEYSPTIPDAVALHFMKKNGVETNDPKVVRLLSLAAQKFVSDIALDAMQQARIKGLGQIRKGSREAKYTLTADLLEQVLEEYGISLDRPPYHL